ncbi:MAG TPA: ABC transporter permease [Anaerolineae bacterium]|nr:ABC transporter permease [Anaerolineae bacterium]HQH39676.1 ABC transporter permease [Anaerolineae bacterium]
MSSAAVSTLTVSRKISLWKWVKRIASNYVVRMLARALFTIWFVTTLIFFLVRLMPSNPIEVYINELIVQYSLPYEQARDQAASLFAIDLNAPLSKQYVDYMVQLLHGNLGESLRSPGTSVWKIIITFLPWTIFSVGLGLLISFLLGVLIGMLLAYRRQALWEPIVSGIASILSSIPNYIIGIVLLVYLGVYWGIIPINQMRGSRSPGIQPGFTWVFIKDIFFHAAMPVFTYVLSTIGSWILSMKSSTIGTLGEDYVTVARARGLSEGRITTAYVGRNAMLPLITQLLISIGFVVGGSILIENIFVYQGIGYRLSAALTTRDYPLMQGIFLIITISVVLSNLIADFVYGWFDPRVRVAGGEG